MDELKHGNKALRTQIRLGTQVQKEVHHCVTHVDGVDAHHQVGLFILGTTAWGFLINLVFYL